MGLQRVTPTTPSTALLKKLCLDAGGITILVVVAEGELEDAGANGARLEEVDVGTTKAAERGRGGTATTRKGKSREYPAGSDAEERRRRRRRSMVMPAAMRASALARRCSGADFISPCTAAPLLHNSSNLSILS